MPHASFADRVPVLPVGEEGHLVTAPHEIAAEFEKRGEVAGDAAGRQQIVSHGPLSFRCWSQAFSDDNATGGGSRRTLHVATDWVFDTPGDGSENAVVISRRFQFRKGTAAHLRRKDRWRVPGLPLHVMTGMDRRAKRWRAALHLIVSVLCAAALGLAVAPAARAAAVTATLAVSSTWQTGFIARFAISNAGTAPLTDWTLEFDLPANESISHTWNSSVARSGTHYILTPANWNRIIAPGGSATGGFRGVVNGQYTSPSNCLLNRQYLCTAM